MQGNYITQQKQLVKKIENLSFKNNIKATVVAIRKDHENDDRVCLTSAVFIPKNIADKIITKVIKPLKSVEPDHFYYPAESMHITIKNIRTTNKPPLLSKSDIDKVNQLFTKIIPQFTSWIFYIEDVIKFPTSISLMGYCDDNLQKLVRALDNGLNKIGIPDDKKYFSNSVFFGNITLCRFTHKPSRKFLNKIKEIKNTKIGKIKVNDIKLIFCNDVCAPKTKRIIGEYQLKNDAIKSTYTGRKSGNKGLEKKVKTSLTIDM